MTNRWTSTLAVLAVLVIGDASCSDDDTRSDPARPEISPTRERDAGSRSVAVPDAGSAPDAAPAPGACSGPAGKTLRTLIVGNSQIYFWDLPKLLSELSESAPPACPRIQAEGFTRGGQNLHRLWLDGDSLGRDLATTIKVGSYDVVVIAESIGLVDLPPPKTDFVTFANLIIVAARASGATPVLYATPYADQEEHRGFVEMATPQIELGAAHSVTVAAGGLAWLRVWKELPSLDLHFPDHAHPGYKGSIISAMVIYSAITRAAPFGLAPSPGPDCAYRGEPCPPVMPGELAVFQRAAWAEARATALE